MTDLSARGERDSPKGFTLLELLLVLGILGVLLGLLLPAVQKAREAANRLACGNNLRQAGLALHQFETDRGVFPPAVVHGPCPAAGVTTATLHGGWTFLLPYLGQEVLFSEYHWGADYFDPLNQPTVTTQLKVLQCPSAEPNRAVSSEHAGEAFEDGGQGACGDYSPVIGTNPFLVNLGLIDPARSYRGVLTRNSMPRLIDITDGTSNTLLVAEDAGRPKLWRAGRYIPGPVSSGGPWASSDNFVAIAGASADGSKSLGACAINCTNNHQPYSFHTDGANFLFADGSVHFLAAGMSIRVLAALATRAGGEVVSGGDW
jgi:prepilin-type N-terminal cleavage/methylation domain-containing protein/prepilin-type processing-associated H-X9-DG protein